MIATMPVYIAWVIWLVVLLVCTALSSLYSGMETGMYVMNKIRLDLSAEGGAGTGRFLRRMLRNSNKLLAVLLIGTNLARYLATFSITSMFVVAGHADRAEWYTLAIATPVMFVVGDAVPKGLFQRAAETLTYRFAWLLRISNWVFNATGLAPLVRGISALAMRIAGAHRRPRNPLGHDGLPAIVAEGRASGLLTQFQSVMANRVMHISKVTLNDAMKLMRDVLSAPVDATRQGLIEIIRGHNYSRIPMLAPTGQVAGVLDILDVLAAPDGASPHEKMTEPFFLPARMNVTDALYRMQREQKAMSVITDTNGKHVGIITIKDLVEEIVGELEAW